MLPRQLLDVAGHLSLRAAPLLRSGATVSDEALSEYWIASRCRIDAWGRMLRTLGLSRSVPQDDQRGDLLVRLVEEIMLASVLTRLVAATCVAHDHQNVGEEAAPIGLNLLDAHGDAISRLRAITYAWWPKESPRSAHARTLSQQAEQWTDMLLAYVSLAAPIEHLAHDTSRLREFAYDCQLHGADASHAASQLLLHSLYKSFEAATQPALNPVLNRRIAGATLALFGDQGFDGHGLPKPVWMLRAERTTEETSTLINRLFVEDHEHGAIRLPARWRI